MSTSALWLWHSRRVLSGVLGPRAACARLWRLRAGSSAFGGEVCHDILTIAARARPHRPEGCQSPSTAICQVPGLAGCGYWLLAHICLGQTMVTGDAKALPKHCLSLLIGERLDWGCWCGTKWSQFIHTFVLQRVWQVQKFKVLRFYS